MRRPAALAAVVAAVLVGLLLTTPGTLALFNDEATVTTRADAFTSGDVSAPAAVRCSGGQNDGAITWQPTPGATGYEIQVIREDAARYTELVAPGTNQWRPNGANGQSNGIYTVTVVALLETWSSSASGTASITRKGSNLRC